MHFNEERQKLRRQKMENAKKLASWPEKMETLTFGEGAGARIMIVAESVANEVRRWRYERCRDVRTGCKILPEVPRFENCLSQPDDATLEMMPDDATFEMTSFYDDEF